MTVSGVARFIVGLAALLFAAAALAFWIAPQQAAERLGVEAARSVGLVTLRADFGGMFAGLALLCGGAVWARHRPSGLAAAVLLAAIVVGRLMAWVAHGGPDGDAASLAIELGVLAALLGDIPPPTRPCSGVSRNTSSDP